MHALERQADEAAARGDFNAAIAYLDRLLTQCAGDIALWLKMAAMRRAVGDEEAAIKAVDRALAISPLDFTALMMRATALYNRYGSDAAGESYARALAQLPEPLPPHLVPVVATARSRYTEWQHKERARLREVAGADLDDRLADMIDAALRLTPPDRVGPTHYCYPGLAERAFHSRLDFPWIAALEEATNAIATEFAAIDNAREAIRAPYIRYPDSAPVAQWRPLNHNRDWTAIHLIDHGHVVEANARLCPATMAALAELPQPDVPGIGPNAMFSLLAPDTHIPPHHGIANTRLVCHLPLLVPSGCWFRVGAERRVWERGVAWVFDDTIEHEAMNPTSDLRVVLIADIWHPDIDADARAGIGSVMAAGDQIHAL